MQGAHLVYVKHLGEDDIRAIAVPEFHRGLLDREAVHEIATRVFAQNMMETP